MTGWNEGQTRLFRYYPEDFGALPVQVAHMDLVFDVYDGHTRVVSALTARTRETPLASLALNARDLEHARRLIAGTARSMGLDIVD